MAIKKYTCVPFHFKLNKKNTLKETLFNRLRFMHTTQNKVEEKFYGSKMVRESVFDIIKKNRGTRFLKYPEYYRKLVDYNFKNIPENTDYCYGKKGLCPYYRFHTSSFMCHCD